MEGVTDVHFRRVVRRVGGCGLMCTEFLPAGGLPATTRKLREMARIDPDEPPIAVQLYGRDPGGLAEGARLVVGDLGAAVVDLNMGCPSRRVIARSGGVGLMREPDVAAAIVRAVRAAVDVPVTVKMRAGWDHGSRNAPQLARRLEAEGADGFTVHWRTKMDGYGGVRDLSTVAAVVEAVSVPVVANGDVVDAASARQTLAETGAAGLMVGRGAIRDPWVFRKIAADLAGAPGPDPSLEERLVELLVFVDDIAASFRSDKGAIGRVKQVAHYFLEDVPELRRAVLRSGSTEAAREILTAARAG